MPTRVMDATDYDRHQEVIEEAVERLGGLDLVLMAHGKHAKPSDFNDIEDLTIQTSKNRL